MTRTGLGFLNTSALLLVSLSLGACKGVQTRSTQPATISTVPATPFLSRVLSDNLFGLEHEEQSQREAIASQAQSYLNFKKGKLTKQERDVLSLSCSTEQARPNPFCSFIKEGSEPTKQAAQQRPNHNKQHEQRIRDAYSSGDFVALASYSEQELLSALKSTQDLAFFDRAVAASASKEACDSPAALTALGLKLEVFLPGARDSAVAVLRRAMECGAADAATKTAYRLGLILIAADRLPEADSVLTKLTAPEAHLDYRSRALYWRMHCARKLKNRRLEAQLQKQLISEYPLSLHALLAGPPGRASLLPKIVSTTEPFVYFRTAQLPEVNDTVRAAEQLLSLGAADPAYDLLAKITDRIATAEPEFRLYVAVLLMRSGDVLKKFQLLTSVFRQYPAFISKTALEMLYPLKRLELIQGLANSIDPLLVLSLIRQESAFNPRAESRVGALGLMQLMPETARRLERVTKKRLFDPETNVRIGVKYFSQLIERYGGDAELALAAYNAGPHRVDDWVVRYPVEERLLFLDLIPFRETREYVASIVRNYYWYLKLYSDHVSPPKALEQAGQPVKLRSVAEMLNEPSKRI